MALIARGTLAVLVPALLVAARAGAAEPGADVHFQTSDRCVACHNGMVAASGADVSIGHDWSPTLMANSARDPYWQAGVRRETLDHPGAAADIQDECAACHMPMSRYRARVAGTKGTVFEHLAAPTNDAARRESLDGVSCSVCHQISPKGLGTAETWNGHFHLAPPRAGRSAEYGPYDIDPGLLRIMRSSSRWFEPRQSEHVRRSELCSSCHTLKTQALGPDGAVVGALAEQMPFYEWQHSRYVNERSCQDCHMPQVGSPVAASRVLGEPRPDVARHQFVGANFFMQRMLDRYREAQAVSAPSPLLITAAERTVAYLATRAATLRLDTRLEAGRFRATVHVANLGGHKLPTAYPARRVWLHVRIRDADGRIVLESGALHADGSIEGNDNDVDAARFEPHYREIRRADQVQIYESVMGDAAGRPTTGLLTATHYLKDNRLLPAGFDKSSAPADIAVVGDAAQDPGFDGAGHVVDYVADAAGARAPFTAEAELLYQPIGFRWAHNLEAYPAAEPQRFVRYYVSMQDGTATVLARASTAQR